MKKDKINNKKLFLHKFATIFLAAIMMVSLLGCEDDEVVEPEIIPVAYVSLYHMSPDAPALDILVDNNRINWNPFEYTEYTGYLRFYTGERELKFTPYNAANTLIETEVTLEEDMLYSVYVTGTEDDLQTMVIEDDIPEASAGNALVRVVHVSPDAPSITLSIEEGDNNPVFEDVEYREASEFVEIPAEATSFEIIESGGDNVLASVSDFSFQNGFVYTIIIRGYMGSAETNDRSLSVQVVPNFFNL